MKRVGDAVRRRAYRAWFAVGKADAYLARPIFIIGSGRSGTTALADVLGRHPRLANVGEARHIWRLLPAADLWNYDRSGRGKLELTADDASLRERARLRRAYAAETATLGGRRFVEKLPEDAFRAGLLDALFPDACFVHLLRDGREVADSIRRRYAGDQRWWGAGGESDPRGGYKWTLLAAHAEARGYGDLLETCVEAGEMGLLEWRLAVEAARGVRDRVGEERWTEVRYDELVAAAGRVVAGLLDWAGLEAEAGVVAYADAQIGRRHGSAAGRALTASEARLAGELLREFV